MSLLGEMRDITISEEAFDKAIEDFKGLSVQLQNLRNDIEEMINLVKEGFDTPAGRKLVKTCEDNLYKPLDDQKLVLEHISETLADSKREYSSVFAEYESLQKEINNVNN